MVAVCYVFEGHSVGNVLSLTSSPGSTAPPYSETQDGELKAVRKIVCF